MSDGDVLATLDRDAVIEQVPLLRRAVGLDPNVLVRLRAQNSALYAYLSVFDVLVGRGVRTQDDKADGVDATYFAAELAAWAESGGASGTPSRKDAQWRGGLPPVGGWQRIETIPDVTIRPLVRSGALALKEAGERGPGLSARGDVAEALLDSVVLTVESTDNSASARLTLRMVSTLTRMGFLTRGGEAGVDVSGAWTRLAAEFGAVYGRPVGLALS
jgi:hypothetical protein